MDNFIDMDISNDFEQKPQTPEKKQKQQPSQVEQSLNSLQESVQETLLRDLKLIHEKIYFYFKPQKNRNFSNEIQNYELWGPFLFYLFFSVFVTIPNVGRTEEIFSIVVLFIAFSTFVLLMNARLLKVQIGYLQFLSITGYLIAPLLVAAVFNCLLHFLPYFLRFMVTALSVGLSGKTTIDSLKELVVADKIYLVALPIILQQICFGCFIFYSQLIINLLTMNTQKQSEKERKVQDTQIKENKNQEEDSQSEQEESSKQQNMKNRIKFSEFIRSFDIMQNKVLQYEKNKQNKKKELSEEKFEKWEKDNQKLQQTYEEILKENGDEIRNYKKGLLQQKMDDLEELKEQLQDLLEEETQQQNKIEIINEQILDLDKDIDKLKIQISNIKSQGFGIKFYLALILLIGFLVYSKSMEEYHRDLDWSNEVDFYEVLEIQKTADQKQIKNSYKNLVKKYHPDRNPDCKDCDEKFIKIQTAYDVLSDEQQKQIYDSTSGLFSSQISSNSIEINKHNYENEVYYSNDIWIIQVYKNQYKICEYFSQIWEDVHSQYPFIKFGRINHSVERQLINKIPFAVREYPFVYFIDKKQKPEFANIYSLQNAEKQLKLFILQAVKTDIVLQENYDSYIENNEYLLVNMPPQKFPQIMMNYYINKIKKDFGIQVLLSNKNQKTWKLKKRGLQEKIQNPKTFFENIYKYLQNDIFELNLKNFNNFCHKKYTTCFLFREQQTQRIQSLLKDSKEQLFKQLQKGDQISQIMVFLKYEKQNDEFNTNYDNAIQNNCLILKNETQTYVIENFEELEDVQSFKEIQFEDYQPIRSQFKISIFNALLKNDKTEIFQPYQDPLEKFWSHSKYQLIVFLMTMIILSKFLKMSDKIFFTILIIFVAWKIYDTFNQIQNLILAQQDFLKIYLRSLSKNNNVKKYVQKNFNEKLFKSKVSICYWCRSWNYKLLCSCNGRRTSKGS